MASKMQTQVQSGNGENAFQLIVGYQNTESEVTEIKAEIEEAQDIAPVKASQEVAEQSEGVEYQTPKDTESNNSEKMLRPQPAAYQTPAKTAFMKLHGPSKIIMNSSDKAVGKLAQF